MNHSELDSFLFNIDSFEEFLRDQKNSFSTSLKNVKDTSKKNNPSLDKVILKKYPFLQNTQIVDIPEENSSPVICFDDDILFSCHPRFSMDFKHNHTYIEMVYVYSGKCTQTINGKQVIMKKGDICLLDTNVIHSVNPTGKDDIIVNCLITKNYLDKILLGRLSENYFFSNFFVHSLYQSKEYNEYILFDSGKSEKIQQLMIEVLCEYFGKSKYSKEVINSYLVLVFSELLDFFKTELKKGDYSDLKNSKISDIIGYVQNNYKDATLISTAQYFHFHPNYLSMIIKKHTARNFTNILHEAKLKRACTLLKNSDIPVVKIANEVGYENTNFFYQIFKKNYGYSPSEYRKKLLCGSKNYAN